MRYIILVLLNIPIISLALINIFTKYKLKKISKRRFQSQLLIWLLILMVIIGSFPTYNLISGRPILDSIALSSFDIVQTTTIVFLIYLYSRQRQKLELIEKTLRDFHQELSIKLSKKNGKN